MSFMDDEDSGRKIVRLCEWSKLSIRDHLTVEERLSIAEAASSWREINRLPALPLEFSGPDGGTLSARQYVGVVEAGGVSIEIYPKLDVALLDASTPKENHVGSVLTNLLWLMDVASTEAPLEADTAALDEEPLTFTDMFALLLARNLRRELMAGVVRRYEIHEGDLHTVRGRIRLSDQITRNANRFDRISCAWDEFTPDIAMNRVLRCACRVLQAHVSGAEARRLLIDCRDMLDEVEDVSVSTALSLTERVRPFDRITERFRLVFDLAVRLLAGTGHSLQTASAETFVFLVDMNILFEQYAHVVMETAFGVRIKEQESIGYLLPKETQGRIAQKADYYWTNGDGTVCIADAKYKHLGQNQIDSLTFTGAVGVDGEETKLEAAGRLLSPDDVRQLTVYAELTRKNRKLTTSPQLMLVYPFVGTGLWEVAETEAWNGSLLTLVPLRLTQVSNLSENLPLFDLSNAAYSLIM